MQAVHVSSASSHLALLAQSETSISQARSLREMHPTADKYLEAAMICGERFVAALQKHPMVSNTPVRSA